MDDVKKHFNFVKRRPEIQRLILHKSTWRNVIGHIQLKHNPQIIFILQPYALFPDRFASFLIIPFPIDQEESFQLSFRSELLLLSRRHGRKGSFFLFLFLFLFLFPALCSSPSHWFRFPLLKTLFFFLVGSAYGVESWPWMRALLQESQESSFQIPSYESLCSSPVFNLREKF